MSRFDAETIAYAASRGIAPEELPLICDGCSGGLSWVYALGGKSISCEQCCHIHDIDYQLGGTRQERADADKRLRRCAAKAGDFPPGWQGTARRAWRGFRAWVMWAVLRITGWSCWADNPVRVRVLQWKMRLVQA